MISFVAAGLLASLVGVQDPAAERVKALVEKLGADDVEEREQASRDLIALGSGALPALEKHLESLGEGEARARVRAVVDRLRRVIKMSEVAPKVRFATVSAKETPLRTLLADLTVQTGVTVECADPVADRPVTIEINAEPVLKAVDRICLARGDLVATMVEGRVKVAAGEPSKAPCAYVDGFRVRLRKKVVVETGEFGKTRTDIVLHAAFDAQPGQKFRGATPLPGAEGRTAAGAFKVKSGVEFPLTGWFSTGLKTIATIDDVMIVMDEGDALELVLLLKEVPADLRSLDSLRLKARYRFPVGMVPASLPLTGRGRATMLADLPYYIHFGGRQVYIYAVARAGQPAAAPLTDVIDFESLSIVDKEGKETKLTLQPVRGGRSTNYQFTIDRDLKDEELTLKYSVLDAFDSEVEFELKDVKLRE